MYDVARGVIKSPDGWETNVWGYADEMGVYIKLGQEFFQIFAEDKILWFEAYDVSSYRTNFQIPGRAVFTAAFTGYLFYQLGVSWDSKLTKYAINMGNGDLLSLN